MNALHIWPYLSDLAFPAAKLDAIAAAEVAGAPQPVIEKLQTLGREQFAQPEALQLAIREL